MARRTMSLLRWLPLAAVGALVLLLLPAIAAPAPSRIRPLPEELQVELLRQAPAQVRVGSTKHGEVTRAEQRLIRRAEARGTLHVLVSTRTDLRKDAVLASVERTDSDVLIEYDAFPVLLVEADADTLSDLASDPRVIGLQEDVAERATLASSVPKINANVMQGMGFDGSGTVVAVLDTGIDVDHPFFAGRIVSQSCFSNRGGSAGQTSLCPNGSGSQTTGNAADAETPACLSGAINLCDHGSHVAGAAAGNATAGTPGAPGDGVSPDAGIIAIQVFTRFNSASDCAPDPAPCIATFVSDQLSGLQRVATLTGSFPIVAANMSLGGGNNSTNCDAAQSSRKAAMDALLALNVATVVAAGNEGFTSAVSTPACISTAIAVGATTDADAVASFSNRGSLLDVFAPGVSIDSAVPNNTYANFSGTSMAAPHVSGAWAILREAHPGESVAQILSRLQTTGVPISYSSGGTTVVTPRIDVLAAHNAAPPPTPSPTGSPSPGACTISGTDSGELIMGTPGDDVICGLGGNDLIVPGGGNDVIFGGPGTDWYSAEDATGPFTIDLSLGKASGPGGESDSLFEIEGIIGTPFADTLIGNSAANDLFGLGGNDTMTGGGGFDYVRFDFATGPVQVNISNGTASGEGNDMLFGFRGIIGSRFADTLLGNNRPNIIFGKGGDDGIAGFAKDDVLFGGKGDDTLFGGKGDDDLYGGRGFDRCKQGPGFGARRSCEA